MKSVANFVELPLEKAFMLIEPGPAILISTAGENYDSRENFAKFTANSTAENRPNVMTLTWKMVLDFSPKFAIATGPWNFSFANFMKSRDLVIAIPTAKIAKKVVEIGDVSGREIDKFAKFDLHALPAEKVRAPLIAEAFANLECRVSNYVESEGIIILDCVKAWIQEDIAKDFPRNLPPFFHAIGDGTFTVDSGKILNFREEMKDKLPPGV